MNFGSFPSKEVFFNQRPKALFSEKKEFLDISKEAEMSLAIIDELQVGFFV